MSVMGLCQTLQGRQVVLPGLGRECDVSGAVGVLGDVQTWDFIVMHKSLCSQEVARFHSVEHL